VFNPQQWKKQPGITYCNRIFAKHKSDGEFVSATHNMILQLYNKIDNPTEEWI
jgi:hypothetical protein